jgi:hypothetical protein
MREHPRPPFRTWCRPSGKIETEPVFRPPASLHLRLSCEATVQNRNRRDGSFGQKLAAGLRTKTEIRVLGWWESGGFRHFSSNRVLRSPADFAGLKMRVFGPLAVPNIWSTNWRVPQRGEKSTKTSSLSSFSAIVVRRFRRNGDHHRRGKQRVYQEAPVGARPRAA